MIEDRLEQVFAEAGCEGSLAVLDIGGPGRVAFGDTGSVVAASTFKIVAVDHLRRHSGKSGRTADATVPTQSPE
ncbi:hypothetical protein ACFC09_14500 [Streptomyces sp. NPDC056161]|uniref:hypothetical protein n=1 Tax=Streptomyces sp. NPDC056161 TaxID=3345732 RepID=UPI0035DDD42C